jgi:23S rRNA (uridine2552-2'-O)-methyltransferase
LERKIKGHVKPTRSVSSNRWMHEHVTDPFVQQAKKLGYRSRASFKIIEIDEKVKLFRRGMTVVDLGAAPGGWSQIAAPKVGAGKGRGAGRVIAIDLLEMPGLAGVEFMQADFSEDEGLNRVEQSLNGEKCDLVLSDMAPNITGIPISDQAKTIYLCELALDFAVRFLKPEGSFVVKSFQGSGFPEYLKALRAAFVEVKSIKPKASRNRSAEVYLFARGLK